MEEFWEEQKNCFLKKVVRKGPFEPVQICERSGSKERQKQGEKLLSQGKVAALVLAGGQGSRLGFSYPKGMFPTSLIRNKSLFQLLSEKTKAAEKKYGATLHLLILTSPLNHKQTKDFFEEKEFFGLSRNQVHFFSQGILPFLDEKGRKTADAGPDGNGSVFYHLQRANILQKVQASIFNILPIENPLADPFDAELVGFHALKHADIAIKSIERDIQDRMGLLILEGGKIGILEYFEAPAEIWENKNFRLVNINQFAISKNFIEKVADKLPPLHKAKKKGLWKCERFLFDLFPRSEKINVLCYPKQTCYAPLKKKEDIKKVQKALWLRDQKIFADISGKILKREMELSPEFYYPTDDLIDFWKNRKMPEEDYIEAMI